MKYWIIKNILGAGTPLDGFWLKPGISLVPSLGEGTIGAILYMKNEKIRLKTLGGSGILFDTIANYIKSIYCLEVVEHI